MKDKECETVMQENERAWELSHNRRQRDGPTGSHMDAGAEQAESWINSYSLRFCQLRTVKQGMGTRAWNVYERHNFNN